VRTHRGLFPSICSFENLLLAHRKAEKGKRFQCDTGRFRSRVERELLGLREELMSGNYTPGGYREKPILHPKPRIISIAPFRDRVVHHAVCNVVMPLFERKMIHDLYSNRAGKGTHAGIRRCQQFVRRFRYVLKCDVRKYFPSIDHELLKAALRRTVRCGPTLALLDRIIDASNPQEPVWSLFPGEDLAEAGHRRVGLPIGNLTSQWFGLIHLTAFDHWVKSASDDGLGCKGYLRYVDDFLLFSDDKEELGRWRKEILQHLAGIRLRINERKCRTHRISDGVTFLGQRVWPHRRRLCAANVRAARRRLQWLAREYLRGNLGREDLQRRWTSWKGHALQADGIRLVEDVRDQLRRTLAAREPDQPCAAGRRVEQHDQQPAVRESQQQHADEHEQQHRVPVCPGAWDRGE